MSSGIESEQEKKSTAGEFIQCQYFFIPCSRSSILDGGYQRLTALTSMCKMNELKPVEESVREKASIDLSSAF